MWLFGSSESRASRDVSVGLPQAVTQSCKWFCRLLATRLVGLAGEVHSFPWHRGGAWLSCLVCCSVGNAFLQVRLSRVYSNCVCAGVFRVCFG